MSKKWLASLAVGTALMGTGVAVGVVATQVSQPTTVQAATKVKTVKIAKFYMKDNKMHSLTAKVPYGQSRTINSPKYKNYIKYIPGVAYISVTSKGKVNYSVEGGWYFKVISAKAQAANAKSKQAVIAGDKISYGKNKAVSYTVKGKAGTAVTVKVPQVKGYKSNVKKMKVGINSNGKDGAWALTKVTYKRK